MYFSQDGSQAFLWPDTQEHGPALLRKSDFPTLWSRVNVGEILRFAVSDRPGVGIVQAVCQIGAERLDPPVLGCCDHAAASLSDCWRDQSSA